MSEPKIADDISKRAKEVNNHLKNYASEIFSKQDVQVFLNHQTQVPFQKQDELTIIHERFKKNQISVQDIHVILKYAKSHINAIKKAHDHNRNGNISYR